MPPFGDMKGGLAVFLDLARTVAEPMVDVTYVFYAREEVAQEHSGLAEILAHQPELLVADCAVLGEPTSAVIEAGCQGAMRLEVTLAGQRAHTARPWMGRNAVHRLAPILATLAAYEARQPEIDGCRYRESLQAVSVEGGVAGNVVPDSAHLRIHHRYAPDRSGEEAAAFVKAHVTKPVIGVPIDSSALNGLDALLSTVQMPPGVPVATVSIGKAGATNAGVLAAQILALGDQAIAERLAQYKRSLAEKVEEAAKKLGTA